MVYCGKPSKGCSSCRERKIRVSLGLCVFYQSVPTFDAEIDFDSFGVQCDQQEPGCGQCEKRQQQCPGYRNLVDLMFRDESSHVIKKANARARKKGSLSSASSTPSPSLQTCQPVTLTWSPDESSPVSIYQGPSRKFSSSSSCASSTGSPPVAFTTTFQVSSVGRERQSEEPRVKQEPGTTLLADIPAPIPCQINPSFEERGLNLFIARYVTVVSHVLSRTISWSVSCADACMVQPENNCHHKFDL